VTEGRGRLGHAMPCHAMPCQRQWHGVGGGVRCQCHHNTLRLHSSIVVALEQLPWGRSNGSGTGVVGSEPVGYDGWCARGNCTWERWRYVTVPEPRQDTRKMPHSVSQVQWVGGIQPPHWYRSLMAVRGGTESAVRRFRSAAGPGRVCAAVAAHRVAPALDLLFSDRAHRSLSPIDTIVRRPRPLAGSDSILYC
jgi:hypothetical protein